jgi:hypothetical protein
MPKFVSGSIHGDAVAFDGVIPFCGLALGWRACVFTKTCRRHNQKQAGAGQIRAKIRIIRPKPARSCVRRQEARDTGSDKMRAGASRGGAVAMNIVSAEVRLVLLCPAWQKFGTAKTAKPGTVILHSRADNVISFGDSEELVRNSGLLASALIEIGNDHRLAGPEPLAAMLKECCR